MDEVTKRDLFAMAALQGLFACPVNRINYEDMPMRSYQIADAMILESRRGEAAEPVHA